MSYKRELTVELDSWKKKSNRKPLIIRGARQVGKTTLVRDFAKTYKHSIYLNLEKKEDSNYFEQTDDVHTILESLLISNNITSKELGSTLLFLDEVQGQPKAIQLLRYFYEEVPELHVIAAGSLLEFALKEVQSFPVGRVEFLYLYPFNFREYLEAMGQKAALEALSEIPIKPAAHHTLLKLFNQYTIIGGMPEIVDAHISGELISDLATIYESIWGAYISDTEKYAGNATARNILKHIMATAAFAVDQRVKFQNFGNSNYRSREVGEAFRNLDLAKIIHLIYPTTAIELPILPDLKKHPRLQFLDTGILNYILGIASKMVMMEDLSESYKGAIIPHIITQELISIRSRKQTIPLFWVREKNQASAEVDLIYETKGLVIPIEIKSGSTGSLKSLHQFMDSVNHPYAVRVYAGEFKVQKSTTPKGTPYILMNLPYFLGTMIPEYLDYFISQYQL
ncbi:ATP-binding protein [Sinomicrobium oceani]|uniref:ATP-binding protein n=1 Tax=Sinomicrobium oceani TaxID=1150368 RepID=UPI00227B2158|nr:AAA family ATPase [Sinomicrobium oceani]